MGPLPVREKESSTEEAVNERESNSEDEDEAPEMEEKEAARAAP
jgi:hypothetical protein